MFGLLTVNETAKLNDNESTLTSGNMARIFEAVKFMSQTEEYNSVRRTNLAVNILSTNA
jgi:hypothetical protein